MSSLLASSNGVGPACGGRSTSGSSPRNPNDNDNNLLKLALKKPKSWKWELTTASSSPALNFPKIQLYDSRTGQLMVELNKPDCVVKSEELSNESSERSRSSQDRRNRYRRSQSSCIREKVVTSSEYLSDVFEQLQSKGMGHKVPTSFVQYRENECDGESFPIQKSKSACEVRRNVSADQSSAKKKVLKSLSSRSSSILGRISELYKSSTEEEPVSVPAVTTPAPQPTIPEITVVEETKQAENKSKIYKLVRSNVGTLMVREESFHTQRSLRRRQQLLNDNVDERSKENTAVDVKRIVMTDIPEFSYDTTIHEIDAMISKVMLSHTLPDASEIPPAEYRRKSVQHGPGPVRRRRSRRSASAGSNGSGFRRSITPGYSSSDEQQKEDLVTQAETRFGSLKRRGRAKQRRNGAMGGGASVASSGQASRQQEINAQIGEAVIDQHCQIAEGSFPSFLATLSSSSSSKLPPPSTGDPVEATVAETAPSFPESLSVKSSSTSLSTLSGPSGGEELSALDRIVVDVAKDDERVDKQSSVVGGDGASEVMSESSLIEGIRGENKDVTVKENPSNNLLDETGLETIVDAVSSVINQEDESTVVKCFENESESLNIKAVSVATSRELLEAMESLSTVVPLEPQPLDNSESFELEQLSITPACVQYITTVEDQSTEIIKMPSTVDCPELKTSNSELDAVVMRSDEPSCTVSVSREIPSEMLLKSCNSLNNVLRSIDDVESIETQMTREEVIQSSPTSISSEVANLTQTNEPLPVKEEQSTVALQTSNGDTVDDICQNPTNDVSSEESAAHFMKTRQNFEGGFSQSVNPVKANLFPRSSLKKRDRLPAETDSNELPQTTTENLSKQLPASNSGYTTTFQPKPSEPEPIPSSTARSKEFASSCFLRSRPSSQRRQVQFSGLEEANVTPTRLPNLATSHSTSSLALLRIQESLDNSRQLLQQQQPVVVQRRQQKSYTSRHHRSSLLLP
ncbi:uncharacterized protein LOC131688997 [Topomyia yanbarensis]|uniref:uncharacterized protein LOC131688997 n=1 Tax=Topomyia yanbarensis TaxID=2498891 RepID=UPI00273B8210|nr:uncharacterized protein LOC131688997 [Topomyia yanbarensis]